MQVTLAPFTGLEIVARSERTEVGFGTGPTRTTVLEVRLRAVRPGHWQIGPARAAQGRDTVEAAPVVVDVAANRAATASTLSPRLRRLLDLAAPPPPGQPAVDLLVSTDSVRVGEQVDVVTAAWFPRDLRLQLRRPPTLQPPVIDGVWSFPQATPSGIAATRNIRGRWYDLFVSHQVVFPLVPGIVGIPRATLKYSTPVALQFFSQEERFALSSRADTLVVRRAPGGGPPADVRRRDRVGARARPAHRPGHGHGRRRRRRRDPADRRGQHGALAQSGAPLAGERARLSGARGRAGRHHRGPGGWHQDVPLPGGGRLGGRAGAARGCATPTSIWRRTTTWS